MSLHSKMCTSKKYLVHNFSPVVYLLYWSHWCATIGRLLYCLSIWFFLHTHVLIDSVSLLLMIVAESIWESSDGEKIASIFPGH